MESFCIPLIFCAFDYIMVINLTAIKLITIIKKNKGVRHGKIL